jgi:hypothetical protein
MARARREFRGAHARRRATKFDRRRAALKKDAI